MGDDSRVIKCAHVYNTCHRSTNAFALAQVVPQNRLPLDIYELLFAEF